MIPLDQVMQPIQELIVGQSFQSGHGIAPHRDRGVNARRSLTLGLCVPETRVCIENRCVLICDAAKQSIGLYRATGEPHRPIAEGMTRLRKFRRDAVKTLGTY